MPFATTSRRLRPALTLLLLAGTAAGCTSSLLKQPAPAKNYFAIQPGAPDQPAAGVVRAPGNLQVRSVRVAPPYDGVAFVYRTGPDQYDLDYYNQFIASPGSMLTGSLTDWLSTSVPVTVFGPGSTNRSELLLETDVSKLLIDFTDKANPKAVMAASFFLTRSNLQSGDVFVISKNNYEIAVPLPSNTPAGYAAAWGQAYGQILHRLTTDLRASLQQPPH